MRKREDKAPVKINALFEVYKKRLRAPQSSVINATVEVIHDILGVSIDPTFITYTPYTKTLALHVKGPIKSEIFLHKADILTHLRGRLGDKNAPTSIL